MAKNRKRLLLSKKNKTSKRRKIVEPSVTQDDINILFRIAELYNTSYDFEAAEWFWGQYRESSTYITLNNSVHK